MKTRSHRLATIVEYDSLDDAIETANPYRGESSGCHDWDHGVSPREAHDKARNGDPGMVADYRDQIDFNVAQGDHETAEWCLSVAGSSPCVPAALMGNPYSMRRRVKRERITRTVRVYVSLVCSAGIPAASMIKRGAAILALIESLQIQGVHVELFLLGELGSRQGDYIHVIPIETPIDLSRAGFAIAHPAFTRHTVYHGLGDRHGFNGRWTNYSNGGSDTSTIRSILEMDSSDILVPTVHYSDTILTDPQAWIRERVKQALAA